MRISHSLAAARPAAAMVAAPATPTLNGVGTTGSRPPVNVTGVPLSDHPVAGRMRFRASTGVVMALSLSNLGASETHETQFGFDVICRKPALPYKAPPQ